MGRDKVNLGQQKTTAGAPVELSSLYSLAYYVPVMWSRTHHVFGRLSRKETGNRRGIFLHFTCIYCLFGFPFYGDMA
jgi:hypothetical protein